MALVLKYHRGVRLMTYKPQGPVHPKYKAVYICSINRDCFALLFKPLLRDNGRRNFCMMNSRVKERTTV
jgi:hypothetical protein